MKAFHVLSISMLLIAASINVSCQKDGDRPDDNWPVDSIRRVKDGLNFPWEILWGKDDHIWMTERGGKISKIDPKTGTTIFSAQLPDVVSQGEGGLLGMVHHPDFLNNGHLYVVYNYNNGGDYREKVVRLSFSNNALGSPLTILDNIGASSVHNGSRLLITPDNKLLITTGDASNTGNSQNISSLNGKILRVNLDGTIPADNPVPGNPYWTYGHRNPQGMVFVNDILYASEHGPNIQDEINIIEKGQNYGWPNVTTNIKMPVWSSGNRTVAVCGLDYYNHDRIGQWKNSLLLLTLKDATLYQFPLNNAGQVASVPKLYFDGKWGRLRDLCISPQGRVYVCTSNGGNDDQLLEISAPGS
ncbi:sorbosone dehydrogenase family protein [Chitinophaga sp. S165]|uniref:PQQ-dependent sugar dehydrogenase n=1 Tax=Chitinophaga sp. S165 TaxID=2135462 RepID=UPI000D718763|nr:PQQ-dependent sugar dehydrogenase [Chitinophaga sp. S165]PWV47037.1 glucose/arabinose dehydrogenase [Chitinophaga sp. S165]